MHNLHKGSQQTKTRHGVPARHIASLVQTSRLQNAPEGSLAYGALHWHVWVAPSHLAPVSPPDTTGGVHSGRWHGISTMVAKHDRVCASARHAAKQDLPCWQSSFVKHRRCTQ